MVPSEIFFCSRSPWKARYRPPMGQNSSALPLVFSRATGQMTGTRHSHAWMQRQLPSRDMANSSLTVQRVTGRTKSGLRSRNDCPIFIISLPGCKSEFLIATQREHTEADVSRDAARNAFPCSINPPSLPAPLPRFEFQLRTLDIYRGHDGDTRCRYRFNDFREIRWRKSQGDNARRRFRISSRVFPPQGIGFNLFRTVVTVDRHDPQCE